MPIESCSKCGRQRPSGIVDPSCSAGGYCKWVTLEMHAAWINHSKVQKVRTKRENVKQALEYLASALNPSPSSAEQFSTAVAIDMLLDALEL